MEPVRAMPALQLRDVARSAAFHERLGFAASLRGEPPDVAIMERGGVALALERARDGAVPLNRWRAGCLRTDDVEGLRAEFVAAALDPTGMHHPDPYGGDDFDGGDPDGHRIAFGQDRGGTHGLQGPAKRNAT